MGQNIERNDRKGSDGKKVVWKPDSGREERRISLSCLQENFEQKPNQKLQEMW